MNSHNQQAEEYRMLLYSLFVHFFQKMKIAPDKLKLAKRNTFSALEHCLQLFAAVGLSSFCDDFYTTGRGRACAVCRLRGYKIS